MPGPTLYASDLSAFFAPLVARRMAPVICSAFMVRGRHSDGRGDGRRDNALGGVSEVGADVILDDGLHQHTSNITSFILSWNLMRPSGVYITEDMDRHTFELNLNFPKDLNFDGEIFGVKLKGILKKAAE